MRSPSWVVPPHADHVARPTLHRGHSITDMGENTQVVWRPLAGLGNFRMDLLSFSSAQSPPDPIQFESSKCRQGFVPSFHAV